MQILTTQNTLYAESSWIFHNHHAAAWTECQAQVQHVSKYSRKLNWTQFKS